MHLGGLCIQNVDAMSLEAARTVASGGGMRPVLEATTRRDCSGTLLHLLLLNDIPFP